MDHKAIIESLLKGTGVEINGNKPQDIRVHNKKFYKRVLEEGSMGLGDAYMDGWWDAERLDELFFIILRADLEKKIRGNWKILLKLLSKTFFNQQTKSRAFKIGEHHYDIGNDLYQAMLDKRMVYTCGYWKNAKNLDEAQEAKLDLVCRKLNLKPGQKVLDIGCGWGSFIKYAAQKYGIIATGVTVSKEQVELGKKLCAGLPVEIKFQDYRDIKGVYNHIVSLGMFEHVGYKNYRVYMETARRHLLDGGLFLLHTIGTNQSVETTDPWIEKHIFPNSMLPSIKQISRAAEELFVMEDWHNFGNDYYKTLKAWFKNFDSHREELKPKYGERFYRMWKYYLLIEAGAFQARKNQLWQIVFSKKGILEGYNSIR